MRAYQIELHETRVGPDVTDDVALFNVTREGDEAAWHVPAFLSPLFRFLRLGPQAGPQDRQKLVAGLGARAIVERLRRGVEPPFAEPLVFAVDYPGAPGEPNPLQPYDQVTVRVR